MARNLTGEYDAAVPLKPQSGALAGDKFELHCSIDLKQPAKSDEVTVSKFRVTLIGTRSGLCSFEAERQTFPNQAALERWLRDLPWALAMHVMNPQRSWPEGLKGFTVKLDREHVALMDQLIAKF